MPRAPAPFAGPGSPRHVLLTWEVAGVDLPPSPPPRGGRGLLGEAGSQSPPSVAWGPTSPLSASPSGSHVDWEGGRESTVTAEPSPRRPTGPAAGCVGVCSVGVPALPGAGHPAVLLSAALVGGDGPAGAPSQ